MIMLTRSGPTALAISIKADIKGHCVKTYLLKPRDLSSSLYTLKGQIATATLLLEKAFDLPYPLLQP